MTTGQQDDAARAAFDAQATRAGMNKIVADLLWSARKNASAGLRTLGANLGDALNQTLFGSAQSTGENVKAAFSDVGSELWTNLKAAGIGALSSYLTAELVSALGVNACR